MTPDSAVPGIARVQGARTGKGRPEAWAAAQAWRHRAVCSCICSEAGSDFAASEPWKLLSLIPAGGLDCSWGFYMARWEGAAENLDMVETSGVLLLLS